MYHELLERQVMAKFPGQAKMAKSWVVAGNRYSVQHQAGQVIFGEAGFVEALGNKSVRDMYRYYRQTPIEQATFAAGLEAFREGGTASVLRKLLTDFGSGYRGLISSASVKVSGKVAGAARPARKLTSSAQDLRMAQEQLWEWSRSAGQRHTKYSKDHVRQLSRFGGLN